MRLGRRPGYEARGAGDLGMRLGRRPGYEARGQETWV